MDTEEPDSFENEDEEAAVADILRRLSNLNDEPSLIDGKRGCDAEDWKYSFIRRKKLLSNLILHWFYNVSFKAKILIDNYLW